MSITPPRSSHPTMEGDRTPELNPSKREKRHREDDEEDDRDRSSRSHRYHIDDREREYDDKDRDRERRHRHRRREETEDERRERHRLRDERREEETEEEREERRRRRKERDLKEREKERESDRDRGRDMGDDLRQGSREFSVGKHSSHRDRSRESHRSYRSHRERDELLPVREKTREDHEAERARRDREMDERREEARRRDYYEQMERERRYRSPPPRRRRPSPSYDGPRRSRPDDGTTEARSIFVSQLSAQMNSQILGMFFEDKLGRGSVRSARVIMDRGRRSKGIGYVELDSIDLVNKALALSGNVVMGIPINVMLSEAERNASGTELITATALSGFNTSTRPPVNFGVNYPSLSTGLSLPPGLDIDAHREAQIPYHRLFISNLAYSLGPDDLRQVFEPFGEIEFVDVHQDFNGLRKGTAYVQYKECNSAQMALDAMHGFDLAGRPIKVLTVQDRGSYRQPMETIEDGGNYSAKLDANQRQQLMYKLARTEQPNSNSTLSAPKIQTQSKGPSMNPTPFIQVNNMFNPEEETERNWDLDLAEDVKGEVESKYGQVKRIKVEKMSAGEVFIEFADIDAATKAIKGLNGRFFGGRQLQAGYISETLFKAHL